MSPSQGAPVQMPSEYSQAVTADVGVHSSSCRKGRAVRASPPVTPGSATCIYTTTDRRFVGSLLYAATYSVGMLSRAMARPTPALLACALRVLKYLHHSRELGLRYAAKATYKPPVASDDLYGMSDCIRFRIGPSSIQPPAGCSCSARLPSAGARRNRSAWLCPRARLRSWQRQTPPKRPCT